MANMSELIIAVQLNKQANISTLGEDDAYMRIPNLNRQPWGQRPAIDTDAGEIGKGHEFITAKYKSHYDNGVYQLQYYPSAELIAWTMAYSLGNVTKSGTTPNWIYTCVPIMPAVDAVTELPYFSVVQQIRPGGSSVLDQLYVGCAIQTWRLGLNKGPGRQSATLMIDIAHSGLVTEPSGITVPALAPFREFRSNLLTSLTINGVDYLSLKGFERGEISWDNAFRQGFYPGSGTQDGFQVQGRLEIGEARVPGLTLVARFERGSTELTKVRALTTGTATIELTNDANNKVTLTWPKMSFSSAVIQEEQGVVAVAVTGLPEFDADDGVFSAVCKVSGVGFASICQ